MRYADGPTAELDTTIEAPPERVWPLVTDITLPARFSSEFQGARWIDGADGPAVGARFRGRNHHPARGEWETTSTVVAVEDERVFEWRVGDPEQPSACWRFELLPEGTGTRLRQWTRLGPGPSPLTAAIASMPDKEERIIERRLSEHRTNMEATLAGIKALAEGENA